jgi:23S rRNA (adenine2030-N6)-methyltransferase
MSLVISKPPKEGLGLYGSGVIVINPPWTLRAAMQKVLPWLRDTLAVDESATYSINGQSK